MTSVARALLVAIGAAFFGIGAVLVIMYSSEAFRPGNSFDRMASRNSPMVFDDEEEQTIAIYRRARESVVFISTLVLQPDPFYFFLDATPREGAGSGLIVDTDRGIVLTNLHVIQDARRIQILLPNGRSRPGRLVGFDREFDIAVVQIDQPGQLAPVLPVADKNDLRVGQRVLAIGSPFGLNHTLTAGIVSSLGRSVRGPSGHVLRGLIQTDAAINPGNSGGPLLDMSGRVVGITTAILSQSGDSAGIGFAVPMYQIWRVLPELIATGKVLRPDLGWILADTAVGPLVRRVRPGGPADQAGIEPLERVVQGDGFVQRSTDPENADVVVAIGGLVVRTRDEVEAAIASIEEVAEVEVRLRRGGVPSSERAVTVRPVLR